MTVINVDIGFVSATDALVAFYREVFDLEPLEPRVFPDARGWFFESFNERALAEHGVHTKFVQDNVSRSARGILRGLHYQHPRAQGKLMSVLVGRIWDVAVDVRRGSATFGKWVGVELSEDNRRQLWIPAGFAHGF